MFANMFQMAENMVTNMLIPNIYLKVPGSTLKYSDVSQSNLKVPRCDEIPAYIYLAKHASL